MCKIFSFINWSPVKWTNKEKHQIVTGPEAFRSLFAGCFNWFCEFGQMESNQMNKIRSACLILCFCGLIAADHVPVLIWGTQIQWVNWRNIFSSYILFVHLIRYEPASALKSYNGDDFIDVINGIQTSDTVTLVITEDQVS